MKSFINKASKKQLKFWLKMFQEEVDSMEIRLLGKKKIIQELKDSIRSKNK